MSHSSETTGGLNKTQNLQVKKKKKKKHRPAFHLCYKLVSYKIKVLQLDMELCSRYNVAVRGLSLRASLETLPGLTAGTEGRFCWLSSSPDALLDGCWSSPSPLSYLEQCAAA